MDAGPTLRIRIEHDNGQCTLTVAGDVDLATSTQLKRALDEALDSSPAPATIRADLAEVALLDTTGLGLLLAARTRAQSHGSRFVVSSTSAELDRLFTITGVTTYLRGA